MNKKEYLEFIKKEFPGNSYPQEVKPSSIDHYGILFFSVEKICFPSGQDHKKRDVIIFQDFLQDKFSINELSKKYKITSHRVRDIIKRMESTNRRYRKFIKEKRNSKLLIYLICINNLLFMKDYKDSL